MLKGLFCFLRALKLHVGVALGEVWVETVHGHVDHLDLAIGGEDLLDVLLYYISGEATQVDLSGFGSGAPTAPVPVILFY